MGTKKNVYETLAKVDVSKHVEKKGDATYLSWSWAWAFVKKEFDDATFVKHTFTDNQNNVLPFMRDYKGNTYVQVSVTIQGQTITEVFPVMDNYMQAINSEANTKFGKKNRAGEDIPLNDVFFNDDSSNQEADVIKKIFSECKNEKSLKDAWHGNSTKINKLSQTFVISVQDHYKSCLSKLKVKKAN